MNIAEIKQNNIQKRLNMIKRYTHKLHSKEEKLQQENTLNSRNLVDSIKNNTNQSSPFISESRISEFATKNTDNIFISSIQQPDNLTLESECHDIMCPHCGMHKI